mmetsp:Transcript_1036/g.1188  ORF Transcript_1036/g.1188 Transcript_1036/m.1188 type:complete len:310 (+) Transcript_1036:101-1030(+)|eukprot:CAMPEP_0204612376 /NCGR_PEP_ID=MMETSP0717-20131115/461_1 /ASSEMBLY_ACC=CAM_ASM_000666 /TAXON_ID=230516 /ORGANISM="Chaetoceros curvisetus" /LENGTH=309 /DNA_ID=CAMNT_0051624425 /DNA_START=707 /DNA_END=1636 /DNA_ORIENTATION=+
MVDEVKNPGTDAGTGTDAHIDDTQGLNIPYIFMVGVSFVVLFFTFFMLCARRWDKWITRKYFSTKIFIPQHMNSFGSSHMSEAVDDSRWEDMSEGTRSGYGIDIEREEIDVSPGSSVNNAWVDEMMHELSNFQSILFGRGRTHRHGHDNDYERTQESEPEHQHDHVHDHHRHPPTPIPISIDPRMDEQDHSIYEHDERIHGEITTHENVNMNNTSLDSDWSSITGSSSGIHIISSSSTSTRSSNDHDSSYLTSYESYESFTCSSDSETVKIKNSKSDPSDEEEGSSVSSSENHDSKQYIGYHPDSEREV